MIFFTCFKIGFYIYIGKKRRGPCLFFTDSLDGAQEGVHIGSAAGNQERGSAFFQGPFQCKLREDEPNADLPVEAERFDQGLERVAGSGLPAYLETATERNLSFYRAIGFEILSDWRVAKDGPRFWSMWREAGQ